MATRVPLHAPETLRWIMQHPGRGRPFTVRALAEASHCTPATIGHLLSGRYRRTQLATAMRIAAALECDVQALFLLDPSPDLDDSSTSDA